ncbi:MAG: asparaginase [bacterium]
MSNQPHIAARVYRGREIEAIHYASIAVVDCDGRLTHSLGDPELVTMMRSAIKPFQLLPLITTGAADHFGFDDQQLAIMCGSHNGSDEHREVVLSNLAAAGNEPSHLQCGCHWPLGMQERLQFPLAGEEFDPVRHNCSGKHSGFLALARYLNEPVLDYLHIEGKVQQLVKAAVSQMCDFPADRMTPGIDGCSAPNYPLSVRSLATGFMRLANLQGQDRIPVSALTRVRQAMYAFPEMVSGKGRFDLALARSLPDNVVCKIGAEAVEGIGLADPPLGIAVKIHDGNWRCLGAVVIEVLKQLSILSIEKAPLLKRLEKPDVRNVRGTITGHIVPEFELRKH